MEEPPDRPRAAHRQEAARLLDVWERLARSHVMAGGGCSCGAGGVVVALEDFEQDIADFLVAETERHGRADVGGFMQAHARNGDLWSIPGLLSSLAASEQVAPAPVADFVLERLGRTLLSFEKLHGTA